MRFYQLFLGFRKKITFYHANDVGTSSLSRVYFLKEITQGFEIYTIIKKIRGIKPQSCLQSETPTVTF